MLYKQYTDITYNKRKINETNRLFDAWNSYHPNKNLSRGKFNKTSG